MCHPVAGACELWQGSFHSNGYGRKWIKNPKGSSRRGYHVVATRYVWEEANGPIPKGLVVRHMCDNPPCVRLDHLELGTQTDNMQDASKRGRTRGTLPATIPEEVFEAVRYLRSLWWTNQEIAQCLSVSQATVSRTLNNKQRSPYGRQL